jgi:hypothetical protein
VSFYLDINDSDQEYFRNLPFLTRLGRLKFYDGLNTLREIPESFRSDPTNRIGSNLFQFDWFFMDGGSVGKLRVIVDDSTADYGVLRIMYADLQWVAGP